MSNLVKKLFALVFIGLSLPNKQAPEGFGDGEHRLSGQTVERA